MDSFPQVVEIVVSGTTRVTVETLPGKRERAPLSEEAKRAKEGEW